MAKLRTGYRILIANYGYYGSIGIPYVMYEVIERDGNIDDYGMKIREFSKLYPYTGECPITSPNLIEILEHLIVSLQSSLVKTDMVCLHDQIIKGKLRKIPDKVSIVVPLSNRVVTAEIVDFILNAVEQEESLFISKEFQDNLNERLPDPFITKIISLLNKEKIPIHDIEDDSRLIAIGEGKNSIVIKKHLESNQLVWVKYPFPLLDLDEIDRRRLSFLNVESVINKDANQLLKGLQQMWNEFKELIQDGVVPKHLISGTNGKTTTARMIAHIIRQIKNNKIGYTSTSGIFIDGEEPDYGDFTGPWSARQLLLNPIDEAVLETARGGLIREGVIFNEVETAILTNVAADHIGMRDIVSVDQMGDLKSLIFMAATKCIVINLDEPVVVKIFQKIKSGELAIHPECEIWGISFSEHIDPSIQNMISVNNGDVQIKRNGEVFILGNISEFNFSNGGIISFMNINAIGALAVTIGYGLDPHSAFKAMCDFKADVDNAPGRGNFFSHADRFFVLDYGHNPHALKQIKQTIGNILGHYKIAKVVFVALTAGDRREEDLREYGQTIATIPIDELIFKDLWVDRRGKEEGEVGLFVAKEVINSGFKGTIHQKPNPIEAIQFALSLSRKNDLVYLCAEKADIMMKLIEEYNFDE